MGSKTSSHLYSTSILSLNNLPSATQFEQTIGKDLPPGQNVNQQRLLAFPVFQDHTGEDVSLKVLHLDYFPNGELERSLPDQSVLLKMSAFNVFPSSAAVDATSEVNPSVCVFGPILSVHRHEADVDENPGLSRASGVERPNTFLLGALEDGPLFAATVVAFQFQASFVNVCDVANLFTPSFLENVGLGSVQTATPMSLVAIVGR